MITETADKSNTFTVESSNTQSSNELNATALAGHPDSFWHSLSLFNLTRITITSGLIILAWSLSFTSLGSYNTSLFYYAAGLHLIISLFSLILIYQRRPNFNWQLTQQICTDVVLICIMIFASGGLQSGLGILLMISLAGAGLISRGRQTLFHAALASIGILLQECYTLLNTSASNAQFTHAALLSLGYFVVAWLAQQLAKRVIVSEALARERSIDLMNMAQINQMIIHDLEEGVLVVDKKGNIRQCNAYAGKLIQLQSQPDIFHPAKLADHAPELAALITDKHRQPVTTTDSHDLSIRNTLLRVRVMPIHSSRNADAIIYLEDLSRIQTQVQQMKLAALGRLTANIAHEIRNPLSSISHAAELLHEMQYNDTTSNRLLHIIDDNTQRLNKIVQDVLQLNRRDTAKTEIIAMEPFLTTFISDFCLTEKIDDETFSLVFTDAGSICFDRNHLNQVLWNLCCNAWRHCSQKKNSISIFFTRAYNESSFYLDIIDDGSGVAAHQQKQLFEPFFTTAKHGTGLGLYIGRELCEANNASLEYIARVTGAQFRVTFKQQPIQIH